MDHKQKIIILLLSGILTVFIFFADNQPSKTNNLHLTKNKKETHKKEKIKEQNNQHLDQLFPEVKKGNQHFFVSKNVVKIIEIIIGIIIIIVILYFFFCRPSYLSGQLSFSCPQDKQIEIYFYPFNQQLPDIGKQQLYELDIVNIDTQNFPPELQKIYQDLKTAQNKKLLTDFVQSINDLLSLLDGYFLEAVHDDQNEEDNDIIRGLAEKLHQKTDKTSQKPVKIYDEDTEYGTDEQQAINLFNENEDSLNFFKKIITNDNINYYQIEKNQKHFLFKHYYTLYDMIVKKIIEELTTFFQDDDNKKQYKNNYQKFLNISQKIKDFLTINK